MTAKEIYAPSKQRIPTRDEFHRIASNILSKSDFDTHHSAGFQVNRVSSALRWSHALDEWRQAKEDFKKLNMKDDENKQ